jgi:uncharacterized coiled-coil protein SlyX
MRSSPLLVTVFVCAACAGQKPAAATPPQVVTPPTTRVERAKPETVTVTVRDPELDRRVARLELQALEREAQIAELETRLGDTRDEVVRTMAKLQSLSSRAEAASGIAEAEVAVGTLRSRVGAQHPDVVEATRLVQQGSSEFSKSNFGGAFYLASQAKARATAARGRLGVAAAAPRPGEVLFAVPIRIKTVSRGNVREGPGTNTAVAFAVESGAQLSAFSMTDDWIRVTDDGGRSGWIFRTLVIKP